MARTKVTLKSRGMAELLKSGEVRAHIRAKAEGCLAEAQATAPVLTGAYRDSLHLEDATTDRAVVRVVADAPHAWIVEANLGVLARSLDAAG